MDGIISPSKYLNRNGGEAPLLSGVCHVFFNKEYISFFTHYSIECVFQYKAIYVYSLDVKKKVFIAIIRNGASLASIDYECLIELGFSSFVVYGYTCCINNCAEIGEIVLINKAYIGEGVSRYYARNKHFNVVSESLNSQIAHKLASHFNFRIVNCYTTEALFMETPEFISELRARSISCIDMECSALATISKYRGVHVAFVFCISDVIKMYKWLRDGSINLRERIANAFLLISEVM